MQDKRYGSRQVKTPVEGGDKLGTGILDETQKRSKDYLLDKTLEVPEERTLDIQTNKEHK